VNGNKHDRNGRVLAHVRCKGTDAGAEQVRQGMAWVLRALCAVRFPAVSDRSRGAGRPTGAMGYSAARATVGVAPALNRRAPRP